MIARAYAEAGGDVVLCSRNEADAAAVAADIARATPGGGCEGWLLTSRTQWRSNGPSA